MMAEKVFCFTKPHNPINQQRVILGDFEDMIKELADVKILASGETEPLPQEFWNGHYDYLKDVAPDWTDLRRMKFDFTYVYGRGICWLIMQGERGLTDVARDVLGNKRNPKPGTIRRKYMNLTPAGISYNTVMHVSDLERVNEEITNLYRHINH
jgi:hypothetical protein